MILLAATEIGFGAFAWLSRDQDGDVAWSDFRDIWRDLSERKLRQSAAVTDVMGELGLIVAWVLTPGVAIWTLALIPIRLRRPRPTRRGLVRQPGFVASVAVSIATTAGCNARLPRRRTDG
jgi:hypothetical protein